MEEAAWEVVKSEKKMEQMEADLQQAKQDKERLKAEMEEMWTTLREEVKIRRRAQGEAQVALSTLRELRAQEQSRGGEGMLEEGNAEIEESANLAHEEHLRDCGYDSDSFI